MDYQNRVGSKKGSGGIAGNAETNQHRRERLRQLLSSKIDIASDPYVFRNRQGQLECRLCITQHLSEGSYIMHTRSRKHEFNLKVRAEQERKQKEQKDQKNQTKLGVSGGLSEIPKKKFTKIGKPKYKFTKIKDPLTLQKGLLFQIQYKDIKADVIPRYRLMSPYEQRVEAPDPKYQYLVIAAEPYETISFKISSEPIDLSEGKIWDYFDVDTKEYFLQLFYLNETSTSDSTTGTSSESKN
ncbi:unnamed protein product [Ambrosiozyma monospora]|uniref:Unnamed protein product n=1 Tax=Ambrosiozyma monospora TaxID=43982 RepID=A0ACB5T198_AMBMO|nr:unnamed protein product [Ambrosiozyma monospora]